MIKFTSLTQISLSVVLPSGKSKRIVFSPLSAGGSVYYTSDPDEIYSLEHHRRFGTLFVKSLPN